MMKVHLEIVASHWTPLERHLSQEGMQQAGFLFCDFRNNDGINRFVSKDFYLAKVEDFDHQSDCHITLTDELLARLIKCAWDSGTSIVEFHSHPKAIHNVSFSPSDRAGLQDIVAYITWRLKGRPYAAVVVGR